MKVNTPTRRNALDRGLELLSLFAQEGPWTFSALASQTGAANAVLSRLLRALVAQQWVEHLPDGRYGPGPQMRGLAASQDPLAQIQAVLNALRDTTACTCLLLVEERSETGPYVRCLAKAGHEDGLGMQEVGAIRTSYLSHPWSWIFLDQHDASSKDQILDSERVDSWLQSAWQTGISQLHQQGWCHLTTSKNCKMAMPVMSPDGTLLACLGLGWPGRQPDARSQQQLFRAMDCAATELARICYRFHCSTNGSLSHTLTQ